MSFRDYLGRTVATIGESLGLPEMNWSEKITGNPSQTVPLTWNPSGAYQTPQAMSYYTPTASKTSNVVTTNPTGNYPTGQVLGASTQNQVSNNGSSGQSYQDLLGQGYNEYYNQLDQMLGGLEPQRAAQEGIVTSQYNQGVSGLQSQREQGLYDLSGQKTAVATSQSKNLRELAANMRNMLLAGNIYLGSRGAGDSSAANMYSYALTKLGNKSRGDILGQASSAYQQIADREFKLENIFKSETNRLASERDQKIMSVSSWFNDVQNQIRNMRASAQKQFSDSVLNQAMTALNQADADARNQRAMLDTWVVNNAKSITEAKQGMASNASYIAPAITTSPIAGNMVTDSSGNLSQAGYPATGYGYSNSKYDIYGRPINA